MSSICIVVKNALPIANSELVRAACNRLAIGITRETFALLTSDRPSEIENFR